MSDDFAGWVERERQKVYAADLERMNTASKRDDGGWGTALDADAAAMNAFVKTNDGINGLPRPIGGSLEDQINWEHGRRIREAAQGDVGTTTTREFSSERVYVPPVLSAEAYAYWHKDGLYGVELSYANLGDLRQQAFRDGRKAFIESIADNSWFMQPGMLNDAEKYVEAKNYQPYSAFRTYNPLVAMKHGFDGGKVSSNTSEGAAWCVQRGADFAKSYKPYKAALDIYEAERVRRDGLMLLQRAWLDSYKPIRAPHQDFEATSAEVFLYMYNHFAKPEHKPPVAGAALNLGG